MGLIQNNVNWIVSGNSMLQECKSEKQLFEKLLFIQTSHIDRPHLGLDSIDIYRLKQPPYESFMRSQRVGFDQQQTFQYQSPKLIQFSSTLSKLAEVITHKNLAPVQFIKINDENNMCMRSVKIDYYSTYYGIQLRDIIENRKNQDCRFEQGQILYVAKSLISFGAYLEKHNVAFGLYKSKNIFISDNGYIKMYLFHMLPENKHVNYFTLLGQKPSSLSLSLPIAPQIFYQLQENNLTPNFDCFKADLFEIGMVLIEMLVESSLQRYYLSTKDGMIFDDGKLVKDLQELKRKEVYHEKIIFLLSNILQTNPENRWSFEKADKYLDQIKKDVEFAYRLNIRNEVDEDLKAEHPKNKVSFKSEEPESQYVLRSIQNSLESKLNPLPLKSLSKMSSNNFSFNSKNLSKVENRPLQASANRSVYTKRRNTGVSIISSSSNQNYQNRSFSRKEEKSSKFSTVRNSRVFDQVIRIQLKAEDKQEVIDFAGKNSCISGNLNQFKDKLENRQDKMSENWMTLGSTRITEENSKNFSLVPPKSTKSLKLNPKLHLHHYPKQNIDSTKQSSSSISTHIKLHKKEIVSPKGRGQRDVKLKISRLGLREDLKQNLPSNNCSKLSAQKQMESVRPKIKINPYFRG